MIGSVWLCPKLAAGSESFTVIILSEKLELLGKSYLVLFNHGKADWIHCRVFEGELIVRIA